MKLCNMDVQRMIMRWQKGLPTQLLAKQLGVCQRRIQQLVRDFRKSEQVPRLSRPGRKPYAQHPEYIEALICALHLKQRMGASNLAKLLRDKHGLRISNDKVHMILRKNNMAVEQLSKQKRRKPWVRYERNHSLSAGHMDWTEWPNGLKCCVVQDDASRKILAGIECMNATAEQSIKLVKQVLDEYGHIRRIREIITDHGTQFYANKRDKNGNAEHSFEQYLKSENVKHILCRYNHPQSNGKVERWFQEYKKHRKHFTTFEEFIHWYNNRPHGSHDLQTPEQVFWQRAQAHLLGGFLKWAEKQ